MTTDDNNEVVVHQPQTDFSQQSNGSQPTRRSLIKLIILAGAVCVFGIVVAFVTLLYSWNQSTTFETQIVTIEPGTTVSAMAAQLAEAGIVESPLLLEMILRFGVDASNVQAGSYRFISPINTPEVAQQLVSGELYHELKRLTFIEGMRAQEYAITAAQQLPLVEVAEFKTATVGMEGTLFPETYFVPDDFTTDQLVTLMQQTHLETLDSLLTNASTSLSREEIVIIASIVEREANTPESMALVAGVFMNRLAIGMPLQADASIEYVIDTPLGELAPGQLAAELRELDSPYNTYINTGLPPTPIGNPGAVALAAVITPTESDFFYYITGNDGEFYYAETYDQHLVNIDRHLR